MALHSEMVKSGYTTLIIIWQLCPTQCTELKFNSNTHDETYEIHTIYRHTEACLECLIPDCQDSRTNSHFNVIDGHGSAAKDEAEESRRWFLEERRLPLRRDLHRMVVPSAHISAALSEASLKKEERETTCLYSRARTSVMRSRRGADAENIHHARGTPISSCGSPLHNYILASSKGPEARILPHHISRCVQLPLPRSQWCVRARQLNGKMRRTCEHVSLFDDVLDFETVKRHCASLCKDVQSVFLYIIV